MAYQTVFRRYELKYLLTREQKERIVEKIKDYMELDRYGRSTIRNIYFDTDSYRLIRRSIEKPAYKEKLRVRSYTQASPRSTVFVELKKKYNGVVYKRRISMPEEEAMDWVCGSRLNTRNTQISKEIDYFMSFYGELKPVVFLSYEREAYYEKGDGSFRMTFDENILCRFDELSLEAEVRGDHILDEGMVLMEIKCSGGIPMWMVKILSEEKIYKTAFSKYGTAYQKMIFEKEKKEKNLYA